MGYRYPKKMCLIKRSINPNSLEYFDTPIQGPAYEEKASHNYDRQVLGLTIPPSTSGPEVEVFTANQSLDDALSGDMCVSIAF